MMTKLKSAALGIFAALLFAVQAFAQGAGQLPAGYLWGNPSATAGRGIPASVGALLDQALAPGSNGVLARTGSQTYVITTTPNLGTPSAAILTNATGLPVSTGISGLGTGIATALGVNAGSAGAVVINGGALGTPSSGLLTNATGLPIGTGVSGLGTGVATFLATPSSANLAAALTDETGSGAAVFASSPSISNPTITGSLTATGLVPVSAMQAASATVPGVSRVRYQSTGVNFNSGNTDTTLTLNLPSGLTRYQVNSVKISHASATLTTATFGLFTASAGGGTAIITGQAITVSTASENTNNNMQLIAPATINTQSYNATQLFFRVQTAEGSAATGDVAIEIVPLP